MEDQSTTTEIEQTLKEALIRLSETHNIPLTQVRLKISHPESMSYKVMSGVQSVADLSLKEALNLTGVLAVLKATAIRGYLLKTLTYLSNQNKASITSVDVRIYTKTDDCEPMGYVFIDGKPLRPIGLEELLKVN